MSKLNNLLHCRCKEKYSIEPHGDARVLYYGRCPHRHGFNIFTITDVSNSCNLMAIVETLNRGLGSHRVAENED